VEDIELRSVGDEQESSCSSPEGKESEYEIIQPQLTKALDSPPEKQDSDFDFLDYEQTEEQHSNTKLSAPLNIIWNFRD
jgi:hypothetical protein